MGHLRTTSRTCIALDILEFSINLQKLVIKMTFFRQACGFAPQGKFQAAFGILKMTSL
jgi:hypothetical protein